MLIENDSSTMNKSEIEINQREVESNFKVNTIQEQENIAITKEDDTNSLVEIKPLLVIEEESNQIN